jgi:hypothetical protein
MLTIVACRKLLEQNNVEYTDEEIELIRDVLYKIADAEIAKLKTTKEQEAAHRKNRRTEYKIIAR